MECAEGLLKEIDPAWAPDEVKPLKPNVHKAPVSLGRISKTALDVLREAAGPMTTSEIADALLAREAAQKPMPRSTCTILRRPSGGSASAMAFSI
jgi:hypothetical protein